ncbi:MAG: type I restriction-modification system protein [Desulfatitalea sp. BRH_c12]|nr:MAG: type I restriction-modification system protein [Desulfatitalea sp. BRH_c12]
MIKSVNNYPISQLFDIEADVVFAIPRYQREYSWGKNQWENLFDDVVENNLGYFLGSIICINQSTDALAVQKLELVDGQQRLTTLSLLFAAVYRALKSHESELDDEQRVELINLKRKLVLKKGDEQIRVIPQIQNNNQNDYRAILAEIGIIGECDAPAYAGNRKIFRTYRYFQGRINEMIDDLGHRIGTIMEFLDKVSHASLVKIEVASHADAYTLFESLNNRGMPLTAIDLIKNKLLARLEAIEPGKVDQYFGHWNRLLGYLGDDYAIQERFFRQYYNAFKDELKAVHQVPVATRSNLIQIYEKFINHDAKDCLQKISAAGRLYSLILSRNQDDALNGIEKPLKDLERIQGAPSYLLLLYLLVRKDELQLDNDHLTAIVSLLVCFFVRRNLTDTPPTRDLTRLFMTIIDKLNGLAGSAIPQTIRNQIIAISASDDVFQRKLEGPIYEENSGVTRFILCALAEQAMTKETRLDLWRFEHKQFVWTIEHIFPQGENIPPSWVAMVATGDQQKAKEAQQTHVHKLGNLTISGFNSALGNKSFVEKRDRTDRQGRAVGYKNGLKLNEDLAAVQTWSLAQIDARTNKLIEQVKVLFKLQEVSHERA